MKTKYVIAALLTLGLIWFLFGFAYRDPYLLNGEVDSRAVTRLTIYTIYFATAYVIALLGLFGAAVFTRRVPKNAAWLATGVSVLLVILLIIPATHAYERLSMPREAFHSFFQYFPPDLPEPLTHEDGPTVLCLGGSTTEWEADGERWTELAEKQLRERTKKNVRVVNQGKATFTTLHSLFNYEARARTVKPDVVVIMHAINDLMVNADHSQYSGGPFRDDYGHHYGALARIARIRPLLWTVHDVFHRIWYFEPREVIDVTDYPGLKPFESNLRRLIGNIRRDGALPVLMTQPHLYKENMPHKEMDALWLHTYNGANSELRWSYDSARRGMNLYNDLLRRIAAELKVPLVELDRSVPKSLEYFSDDCHYTVKTQRVLAKKVTEALTPILERIDSD